MDGLPNNTLFERLVLIAKERPGARIHDLTHGVNASYDDLLQDVVAFRRCLQKTLPSSLLTEKGVIRDDDVYICTAMETSYEMMVAFIAIISIGAAVLPLGM